ncbi:unnamed protein product [Trichogramma brassicae]|uniref:RNA-directed DNA polymerase n=1 Tax=Trichogramma brassicae TaxID=86971 RepID=A0A6H5IZ42_9HYME|nr:unnamed protein product [Trichogramma brassicae]
MPETAWDEPEAREKPSSAKLASLLEPIDDIARMIEKLLDQKLQGLTTAITAAASAAGNRTSNKKRTTSPKNKANADRTMSTRKPASDKNKNREAGPQAQVACWGTFTEHLEKLELVLKRIADANLTINREKSFFCQASVKFLGVIVDREGIRPDPYKTAPMVNFPAPKTLKKLRRFLGMASWDRKFLKNFATIAEPLTRLTRKGEKFTWAEDQQNSFEKIRSMLATAPVLNQPSFEHEFVIQTDASDTGLGAVLTQIIDDTECVLCFASRTMNAAERNYSVTERECLAVLWVVQKFRLYVEGYHFKVISDHSSLKWLHNLKKPDGQASSLGLRASTI